MFKNNLIKILNSKNKSCISFYYGDIKDIIDPLTLPKVLLDAHKRLDKAVDLCYCPQVFTSELKGLEFLFELYEKYTSIFTEPKKGKRK